MAGPAPQSTLAIADRTFQTLDDLENRDRFRRPRWGVSAVVAGLGFDEASLLKPSQHLVQKAERYAHLIDDLTRLQQNFWCAD